MILNSFKGYLLAAHPKRHDPMLRRGVILVTDHNLNGAVGLQINKPFSNDLSLSTVMSNVGLTTDNDQPLYNGGIESVNRIHVVHTLDWYTASTIKITESIGISHDVSVLTAISENEGPENFRVVAGVTRWPSEHLDGEILGEDPWDITHTWSYMPADSDTLFSYDEIDQWHRVIAESSKIQTSKWFFNPSQD